MTLRSIAGGNNQPNYSGTLIYRFSRGWRWMREND